MVAFFELIDRFTTHRHGADGPMSHFLLFSLIILLAAFLIDLWVGKPKRIAKPASKPDHRYSTAPTTLAPLIPWRPELSAIDAPEAFGYRVFTKLFDEEIDALRHVTATGSQIQEVHEQAIAANEERINARAALTTALADCLVPTTTAVTLLVDNSGSMRVKPALLAVELVTHIAYSLTALSIPVEILGFTSATWKGGRSRLRWLSTGQQGYPGRLCDLKHIVYKPFDETWEARKSALGLIFENDALKENVDGEALVWAYKRLCQQSNQRRILLVISDGAPVDGSTLSVNTPDYLERHLRHVIDDMEWRGVVELSAIGLGHDVSRYYKRSCTIAGPADIADLLSIKLPALLMPPLLKAVPASATDTVSSSNNLPSPKETTS
jgi:cobaltochelatase CobT